MLCDWNGGESFTHSAGQPERVRDKTPRKATRNDAQFFANWVGVGAAERAEFLPLTVPFATSPRMFFRRKQIKKNLLSAEHKLTAFSMSRSDCV